MKYSLLLLTAFLLFGNVVRSQCDPATPTYNVDLSSDPNGSYLSPDTVRNGYCCGASGAVRCIEFVVTLHPNAEGILFEIFSGAVPGGALFYQIGCGPPENVGTPICLTGAGPHRITFCKPGKNTNVYKITSIGEPMVPDSIAVNEGCTGMLASAGFDQSSITWNTVFPGAPGAYNSYLSCTAGCDTTFVTAQPSFPPFIEVEICGFPFGGCNTLFTCDTVKVNFFSTLSAQITPISPTVCFGSLGTHITANPGGGSPPYVYNWNTGDTTASIFVDTGIYIVELGDVSGCPPTYDTVIVMAFDTTIIAQAGSDIAACFDQTVIPISGNVIGASGGVWTVSGMLSLSSDSLNNFYSPTPAELAQGFAQLQLTTTGNGTCPPDIDTLLIFFNNFDGTVTTSAKHIGCFGGADGRASVLINGNASPYKINWDAATGNQTGDTAFSLIAGSYQVTITDSLGCMLDTSVQIIQADSLLEIQINATPITCFGDSNGVANIAVTGGIPDYQFNWDNLLNVGDTHTVTGLKPGAYSLEVSDSLGCVIDTSVTIIGPTDSLDVTFTVNDVSCLDGNDGTITAIPSGGIGPYSYLWDSNAASQTAATASGLIIGTYAVTVRDSLGCIVTDSSSVSQPSSAIGYNSSVTSPSCFGGSDGTATVFPSGGTPPYTFLWDSLAGNQTTQTATGLSAGFYQVTIFDQNTCLLSSPIQVVDPPQLFVLNIDSIDIACFGDSTGQAIVTPVGGTPPYTFLWSANANNQTDSIATNLGPGSYSVTVWDLNSCAVVPGIIISQPIDSLSISMNAISVSCLGGNDGKAIAIPSGGRVPYTYLWDVSAASQTTDTAGFLVAGNYAVTVTDSSNCTISDSVLVAEPLTTFTVQTDSISINCYGDSSGIAIVSVLGGNAPYSFQWGVSANFQTGDSAFSLPAGTHAVKIIDSTNCEIDTSVVVTQPASVLNTTIDSRATACFAGATGSAWVDPSGGTMPYSIAWGVSTGNQTGDTATQLSAGTYSVRITDTLGCFIDTSVAVIQPAAPLTISGDQNGVSCFGNNDGYAFVHVTGGFVPYTYLWPTSAGSPTTDTAFNLNSNTYMVTVSDSLGCTDNLAIFVTQPDQLNINMMGTNLKCNNDSSGTATAEVSGGTAPYQYTWNTNRGIQTSQIAIVLDTTWQFVTVVDSLGCSIDDSVALAQPPPLRMTTTPNDTICPGDSVLISGFASGGNGFYSFTWDPLRSGNDSSYYVTPFTNANYVGYAEDSMGCRSNSALTSIFVNNFVNDSSAISYDKDICPGDTATIVTTHVGDFIGYSYRLEANDSIISVNPGINQVSPRETTTYTFTVTNSCGISTSDSVRVTVFPIPMVELDPNMGSGCIPLTVNFRNRIPSNLPNLIYIWNLGDGTEITDSIVGYVYKNHGSFDIELKIITENGCVVTNSAVSKVIANPLPDIKIDGSPLVTDLRQPNVLFESSSTDGSYYWDFGDDSYDSIQNTLHIYQDSGRYNVRHIQTNSFGCVDSSDLLVIVEPYYKLEIPNAFTPDPFNGNGGKYDENSMDNNVFHPHTEGVIDYHLTIFNRWGELVFESFDLDIGWDGYYRGKLSQQEVYIWKLSIIWENGQQYKGVGDVTLFR